MTGIPSLNLSAICCASLKLRGTTRCTLRRTPGVGARLDARAARRPQRPRVVRAVARLRVGPVLELARPAARRQPADVRALAVGALELLVRDVAVLVPVLVLLGDAEVDERAVPEVGEAHGARNVNPDTGTEPTRT